MNRKTDALTPALALKLGQTVMHGVANADASIADETADAALRVPPAASPTAPALLASRQPGGPQAQRNADALYRRCLAHYRSQVRQGERVDDLPAAIAYFVLANLAALHGHVVSAAQLADTERQMRALFGGHPAWAAATLAERQSLFEQLAALGVLVGESQAQARTQGAAALANVQRAARGYLQQLLGIDADALDLTPDGLRLRSSLTA